jgi:hypothetical protein
MTCPFCGGLIKVLVGPPDGIMHSKPQCQKFDDEDPLTFIRNVRLATYGPAPGDHEIWDELKKNDRPS